jgi:uncharacterized protein (TIGR02996 family)
MSVLEDLLAGIVADPQEETRWLVLADWLEEFDDPRRAELLRLHRQLLATCCEPQRHPQRSAGQSRIVALIAEGVRPCVPQETITLPGGVGITFSFIPPGSFLMGSNHPEGEDDEKPVHRVTLTKGFYMGIHPVTQAHWKAITGANPSSFPGENRPVEQVCWDDCQEFCVKLTAHLKGRGTVRMPTEAEWEYACRAGTTTKFHFGDILTPDLANYNRAETTEVGSFRANPWGLFDMHGNVWEWCEDEFEQYSEGDQIDPQQLTERSDEYRVLRGGCWGSDPVDCRAAFRLRSEPGYCYDDYGCRVCFRLD